MPSAKDVSVSDLIEPTEYGSIAEMIVQEWRDRQKRRDDLEKHWKEVDRQLRMEPELSHKTTASGKPIKGLEWLPETETPLQSQALEILMSDVRRFLFPKNRDSFRARAAFTEKYINRFNRAGSPFIGEASDKEGGPHAILNNDTADRLAAAIISHWRSQYDFRGHNDQINAQAISYGFGAGRLKMINPKILRFELNQPRTVKNNRIPVLVPRDVKRVYVDDNVASVLHEGEMLGPNTIQTQPMKKADLMVTAADGEDGWIPAQVKKVDGKNTDTIELIELEGDIVVDSSQSTLIVRDIIVTAAVGVSEGGRKKNVDATPALVRIQEGEQFSSYVIQHYHLEGPAFAYGASPLIKGMPIAKLIAQTLNRIIEAGQLQNSPPTGWDKNDTALAAKGGPIIKPYALWETADLDAIKVFAEVGGDPQTLFSVFQGLLQLYADMTGVTPPRLGAQTKSHTTAFAKDVELNQGAVRTVDYTNSILEGPMTRSLELEYRMGIKAMRGRHTIYIPAWKEFVSITKSHLPDVVKFEAIGAGAPAEDEADSQRMLNSAQLALQLDLLNANSGEPRKLKIDALMEQVLARGGWRDINELMTDEEPQIPDQLPGVAAAEPAILDQ